MANALTDMARAMFARGAINWESDTLKCVLVDTASVSFTTINQTSSNPGDIPANMSLIPTTYRNNGASGAVGMPLANKAVMPNGACDADDVTFTAVQTLSGGGALEAVVIYKDGASDALRAILCWLDTATGLPIVPNGGDIICTFDGGVNRLFRL
jgi:hypothetical protein